MRSKIPTILGIVVLVLGMGAGIFLVATSKQFKLGASPDVAPQDVKITNLSSTSFTVSWITDKPTVGFVKYGTAQDNLSQTTLAPQDATTTHWIQIISLTPSTPYYFKINSASSDYDNSGIPWNTQTAPQISSSLPTQVLISGTVQDSGGLPAPGVLVYVNGTGVNPMSALTSANGNWIITLSTALKPDLTSYANISPDSTLLQVFVQGGVLGVSTAQIYPKSANPTPAIKLGTTYDFRSNPSNAQGTSSTPQSNLNLPENATSSGGFNLGNTATTSGTPKTVTITSIKDGEIISTTKPQIIGTAAPNTKITITVRSTPQSGTVTAAANGTWTWNPPANLDPGTHTLSVSWTDAQGILQTLTKTFVVQASEGPAFVASGSATPRPTPTPTPPPAGGSTSSATTRVTLPATQSAIPVSGDLTPTLALSMMGIGLVVASFITWKYAK